MRLCFVPHHLRSCPARGPVPRALALLLLVILAPAPGLAAQLPAVRGEEAMVVTPEPHATAAGVEILRAGGNALDAAVAVGFVLAVTFPQAGNLGGGGFMLYRSPEGEHRALDFRERAPRALRASLFLDELGSPIPDLTLRGGLSVGVPGSVAGLAEIHQQGGSLPWRELLQPAIRLAEGGFTVSPYMERSLARHADKLAVGTQAGQIFFHEGKTLEAGTLLVQPDLAASLRAIADGGPDAFYRGPLGRRLVQAVREAGGVMDEQDLADYRPTWRDPVAATYRGYHVVSFPPPSSGGVALLQILAMLERFDLGAAGAGSSLATHLVAEAERRAYADRSQWLGDPAFYDVPLAGLLDADYLQRRGRRIRPGRATGSKKISPGEPPRAESPDTLHFSIADPAGRAVALTTTLNASFGNGIVAAGTGILLNNEIDDFAVAPGVPNAYGLLGGEANAVQGGKRPLSSMTPTIVEFPSLGERPALVLGSPGGATIITTVLQVLINVIDHDMPLREAVEAPRFHHQWRPDEIRHEPRAFPADVRDGLERRRHILVESDGPLGNVNAIGLAPDGAWLGAADPRRAGAAQGF